MFHLPSLFIQKALAFGGSLPGSLPSTTANDPRSATVAFLGLVLDLVGLLAAIIIVIAGIRLISSQGDEEAKIKAKNTIFFVAIGLLVILFARAIISFTTGGFGGVL